MLSFHLVAAGLATAATPAEPPRLPVPMAAVAVSGMQAGAPEPLPEHGTDAPPPDDSAQAAPDGQSPPEVQPGTQDEPPVAESDAAEEDDLDIDLGQTGLENDPLEGFNRISFSVSQVIDRIVIRPAAIAYRNVIPKPARDGAHNVLSNLGEPLIFFNDVLQLRPDRAIGTLGRFLINSTLGIGGLFDIAKRKPFKLPHHPNSFGDTLGYYGVKPGPYIYLPVIGPTTLRDAIGGGENLIPPAIVHGPLDRKDFNIASVIVDGLDRRERSDDELKAMLSDAIDPYATFRANYLQDRAGEIAALKARKGEQPKIDAFDDPLTDPAVPAATPEAEAQPAGQ